MIDKLRYKYVIVDIICLYDYVCYQYDILENVSLSLDQYRILNWYLGLVWLGIGMVLELGWYR